MITFLSYLFQTGLTYGQMVLHPCRTAFLQLLKKRKESKMPLTNRSVFLIIIPCMCLMHHQLCNHTYNTTENQLEDRQTISCSIPVYFSWRACESCCHWRKQLSLILVTRLVYRFKIHSVIIVDKVFLRSAKFTTGVFFSPKQMDL